MKRLHMIVAICLCLALFGFVAPTPAYGYHTNFQQQWCNMPTSSGFGDMPGWRRQASINYGTTPIGIPPETGGKGGYQWQGGCWDSDGMDDSPGDPVEDPNTGGEGGDCSGFTFKTWALRGDAGETGGFRGYDIYKNIHGPYTALSYQTGDNSGFGPMTKSRADMADAFASSGHIGIVYSRTTSNTDVILQAKSESEGTLMKTETYRGNSSYNGVRRKNWTEVDPGVEAGGVPIRI